MQLSGDFQSVQQLHIVEASYDDPTHPFIIISLLSRGGMFSCKKETENSFSSFRVNISYFLFHSDIAVLLQS